MWISPTILLSLAAAVTARPQRARTSPSPSSASPLPTPTNSAPWVNLHVIGDNNTKVFEGQLTNVQGQTIVTTSSGGSHPCGEDTNDASLPGGAPIVALAQAASRKKFIYDATWDGSSNNFDLTTIATYVNEGNASWATYVNFDFAPDQATCSKSLNWGANEVWFIYNPAQYQHLLHLHPVSGNEVSTGRPFPVTVTDYVTGQPVQGAIVQGKSTDADGHATIELDDCGPYNIRATQPGSLDSNWIYVISDPYRRKRCV